MANRHSPEARARAVRMVLEIGGSYEMQGAAIAATGPEIGCIPQTLGISVRQANEIPRKASAYFAQAVFDRPFKS